jgi:hypothetical protein
MKNMAAMILLIASAILLSADPSTARSKLGISGRYACGKNAGDTCTATCKMMTFTTGATGGAIMRKQ